MVNYVQESAVIAVVIMAFLLLMALTAHFSAAITFIYTEFLQIKVFPLHFRGMSVPPKYHGNKIMNNWTLDKQTLMYLYIVQG